MEKTSLSLMVFAVSIVAQAQVAPLPRPIPTVDESVRVYGALSNSENSCEWGSDMAIRSEKLTGKAIWATLKDFKSDSCQSKIPLISERSYRLNGGKVDKCGIRIAKGALATTVVGIPTIRIEIRDNRGNTCPTLRALPAVEVIESYGNQSIKKVTRT